MKLQKSFGASATRLLMLVAVCAVLFAFTYKPGGDSFTIYLNDQLLLREAVHNASSVKSISLSPDNAGAIMKVHYSHCGKTGTDRNLSVRDGKDKTLKSWTYTEGAEMIVQAKEITSLNNGSEPLNLVYSSLEIPEGKVLALVNKANAGNTLTTGQ